MTSASDMSGSVESEELVKAGYDGTTALRCPILFLPVLAGRLKAAAGGTDATEPRARGLLSGGAAATSSEPEVGAAPGTFGLGRFFGRIGARLSGTGIRTTTEPVRRGKVMASGRVSQDGSHASRTGTP